MWSNNYSGGGGHGNKKRLANLYFVLETHAADTISVIKAFVSHYCMNRLGR